MRFFSLLDCPLKWFSGKSGRKEIRREICSGIVKFFVVVAWTPPQISCLLSAKRAWARRNQKNRNFFTARFHGKCFASVFISLEGIFVRGNSVATREAATHGASNWCREARARCSRQLSRVKEFRERTIAHKASFVIKSAIKVFSSKKIPRLIHNTFPTVPLNVAGEEIFAPAHSPARHFSIAASIHSRRSSCSELFLRSVSIQFLAWLEIAPPPLSPSRKHSYPLVRFFNCAN